MKKPQKHDLRKPEYSAEPEPELWKDCRNRSRIENVKLEKEALDDIEADTFSECILDRITLGETAKGILFADVLFDHCDLSNAVLDDAVFRRCSFRSCRMLGTSLIRSTFTDVTLEQCGASYANFNQTEWKHAEWNGVSFEEAALAGCRFQDVELHDCDFTGCDFLDTPLAGMDFSDSVLQKIMVRPQDLNGAVFSWEQATLCAELLGVTIK